MPEGDTIRRLAARIDQRFVGERCTATIARHPRLVGVDFAGHRLIGVEAVGKHLLLRFDDGRTIHSHLQMDGSWLLGRRSAGAEFSRRLELHMESGWMTAMDMPVIGVVSTADEQSVVGHLGLDLCAVDPPDLAAVTAAVQRVGDVALATAMLDQRVVAGFGNVYAVEVPFISGVSPFHRVADIVGLDQLLGLGAALIRTNAARTSRNTTGRKLHTSDHWVYGHAGAGCPICGTRLGTMRDQQTPWRRATTWCPSCQPGTGRAVVDMERIRRAMALHPARRDALMPV